MLHIDKWCRISAIDCTMKDVFPPLYMIRNVGNWGRVGATRNMMSLGASGSIRGALGIHEPRWCSGLLWEILGASGSNWEVLGTSGDAWELQGAYGSLRF